MREMNELIMSCRVAACSGGGFGSKSASTPKKQQPKVQRIKRGDKVVQKKGSFLAAYCEGSDVVCSNLLNWDTICVDRDPLI